MCTWTDRRNYLVARDHWTPNPIWRIVSEVVRWRLTGILLLYLIVTGWRRGCNPCWQLLRDAYILKSERKFFFCGQCFIHSVCSSYGLVINYSSFGSGDDIHIPSYAIHLGMKKSLKKRVDFVVEYWGNFKHWFILYCLNLVHEYSLLIVLGGLRWINHPAMPFFYLIFWSLIGDHGMPLFPADIAACKSRVIFILQIPCLAHWFTADHHTGAADNLFREHWRPLVTSLFWVLSEAIQVIRFKWCTVHLSMGSMHESCAYFCFWETS